MNLMPPLIPKFAADAGRELRNRDRGAYFFSTFQRKAIGEINSPETLER